MFKEDSKMRDRTPSPLTALNEKLKSEISEHPSCSPDLAPRVYYLHLHLEKFMIGQAEESTRKNIRRARPAERLGDGVSRVRLTKTGHTS